MQDPESMNSEQSTQRPLRPNRSVPIAIIAGLSVLALFAGGGAALWTWQHSISSKPIQPLPAKAPTEPDPTPVSQAPTEQTVEVYWLKTVDDQIEPAASPVKVAAADRPEVVLKAAFDKMLEGAPNPELTSTIPPGTKLYSLEVKEDGVHLDLSQEFTTGGGSTSMTGRLAQVLYTATTLNPDAPVWISVEGKPLDVLGGEGLIIDQPMTRESFKENFEF